MLGYIGVRRNERADLAAKSVLDLVIQNGTNAGIITFFRKEQVTISELLNL